MAIDDPFHDPPWDAPLDPEAVIAGLPEGARMKGMFLDAVVSRAAEAGVTLPSAKGPYLGFRWYPLAEHCRLLVELARGAWPDETLRQGLRRVGRGAATALTGSTLGKVTVGAAQDPAEVIRQMAKTFALLSEPGHIDVADAAPGLVIVALHDIHFFEDSHHVGVYEGALRFAQAPSANVAIRRHGPGRIDLACTWQLS